MDRRTFLKSAGVGAAATALAAPNVWLTLIATSEPIITENRRNTIQSFDSEALAIPHLKI